MAIEIIKSGKNKEKIETTCDNCGCVFSFEREDCYWDRPMLSYVIECPECKESKYLGDIFKN